MELAGGNEHDDDVAMNAIPPDEDLAHLAEKLSALADPLAFDMIRAGYEEGIVDDGHPVSERHQGGLRGRRTSPL